MKRPAKRLGQSRVIRRIVFLVGLVTVSTPNGVPVRAIDQGPSLATWLSAEPFYGSVPGDDQVAIQVTFDSTGLQEGGYQTDLIVQSNDSDVPLITVPVTLTVAAAVPQIVIQPVSFGELLVQGETLSRTPTISVLGLPDTALTDRSGFYELSLQAGRYTLQVSAIGYVTQTAPVEIRARQTTTQDFDLQADLVRIYLPLVIQ